VIIAKIMNDNIAIIAIPIMITTFVSIIMIALVM
jgi:hypothetical protein